jgi:hypothetical protein
MLGTVSAIADDPRPDCVCDRADEAGLGLPGQGLKCSGRQRRGLVCDTLAHGSWLKDLDGFAEAEQGGAGPIFAFERDGDVDLLCAGQGDTVLPVSGEELAQAGERAGFYPDCHLDRGTLVL